MPVKFASVPAYLEALDPASRVIVDRLRHLASSAADDVTEQIKWNAPSFGIDDDDRITLGTDPKGCVRIILHRGVKPKDASGFHFDAPDALVIWAAPDRGVITVCSDEYLSQNEDGIADIFARWLEATR